MSINKPPIVEDPRSRHVLVRLVLWVISLYAFLILAGVIGVLIEWAGMALALWSELGAEHARVQFAAELGYLGAGDVGTLPPEAAWVLTTVFRLQWTWSPIGWGIEVLELLADRTNPEMAVYIEAGRLSVQVLAARVTISVLTLPAFVLVGGLAMLDGLVQRDLRKFGGGHESSLVYHWAARHVRPLLVTPWVLYLSSPFTVHPNFVFIPCLIGFGMAVFVSTSKFKKVL